MINFFDGRLQFRKGAIGGFNIEHLIIPVAMTVYYGVPLFIFIKIVNSKNTTPLIKGILLLILVVSYAAISINIDDWLDMQINNNINK